jgi:hypothetical protein
LLRFLGFAGGVTSHRWRRETEDEEVPDTPVSAIFIGGA